MLEAIRQYSIPLVLAVALHAVAAMALYANWNPPEPESRIVKPQIVQSKLVVMEPKPKPAPPRPQPVPQPKPQPESKPPPEPAAKPEPEKPKPDPEAERRRADEAARRQAEEQARQERLEALARTAFQEALDDEASELAESDMTEDEAVAQSYRNGIYQAVVANWSRPPSARNRMEAKLLVELVPTGDVVGVTIIDSSGNAAFDRSAEAAVRKARRFEVPDDPDVFEEHFRRFTLLFRPEDLLR